MSNARTHISLTQIAAGLLTTAGTAAIVAYAGGHFTRDVVLLLAAFGISAAIVPLVFLNRSVIDPMERLRDMISQTSSDGDLARRLQVPPASVLASVTASYNGLMATLQGIITRILFTSTQVAEAANGLIVAARETAEGSERQIAVAREAAAGAADVVEGVNQASLRAEETTRIAQAARSDSARGTAIVLDASAEISRIAQSVEHSAQVVANLGERSKEISGIANVIHAIADQTNLLALNAAIEAARAGEQGRGFAVVADEVRKLAERTTAATGEISAVIGAIQYETASAITAIKAGSEQAANGAELARKAAEALESINAGAQDTLDHVSAIAATMSTQRSKAQAIASNVNDIIGLAEQNARNARETLDESTQLTYLATNLQDAGKIFKLGTAGDAAMKLHERMPPVVQGLAKAVGRAFEDAIERGQVTLSDLFDANYDPIPNTRPQKFRTKYDAFCDRLLPAIQEPPLQRMTEVAYAIACDRRGYVPTHNARFTQPLTGDEKVDIIGNRTKRIFDDPVGKRCGDHELPFLLQTYRRDTGEIMHDMSAPVYVNGQHWGGVRVGYRTE